ncbi:MAG: hypothetical protein L0Z62_44585 [Gemmataceae bacterium]|nr:hypothetical protein [Gemmataceae bacterium]
MPPAARVGSSGTPPHVPPTLTPGIGSLTVQVGGGPAWRANIDIHTCTLPIAPPAPAPHGPEICFLGALTVLIDSQMAVRQLDLLTGAGPPNPVMLGVLTVLIGDPGVGLGAPASISEF